MFKSEFRSISHNAKYVKAARWRQGGGKVPLPGAYANAPSGGRAAADTGRPWLGSKTIYAAHNKRGQRRERM